ncbi:MAG TPA: phosphoribosylanthranilate isomerase [Bryobacteraceae bacterium]|nr:phosphoribosylanthranilate isomerase [Bryobacteraceae bacterium]
MMVKICGITNLSDALAAVEAGASALGFNFFSGSPRYIQPEAAALITAKVPDNVLKVGVFVNETPARIQAIASAVRLDVAQLHGDESPDGLPVDLRTWKAFRMTPGFTAATLHDFASEAFLLDAPSGDLYGGSGQTFPWAIARGIQKRIILAGGLDASNVALAIKEAEPWGVDACSRLEVSPGQKDHNKMRSFLHAALSESL